MEDTVTKEWVEQMIDLTSLGHLMRSKANDPAIGFLIEVFDVDLDLAEVGTAFSNDDLDVIREWNNSARIGMIPGTHQMDKAAVYCFRIEPIYLFKRTGGLYE